MCNSSMDSPCPAEGLPVAPEVWLLGVALRAPPDQPGLSFLPRLSQLLARIPERAGPVHAAKLLHGLAPFRLAKLGLSLL